MTDPNRVASLGPTDVVNEHPVADPAHIPGDINGLRYMIDQLSMYLENKAPNARQTSPTIVRQPEKGRWVYRLVVAGPAELARPATLTFVGFLGQRRAGADTSLIDAFDATLLREIPQHPGLLSYSSMALISGNYSNLVLFAHEDAKVHWSRSKAHHQAVSDLAPNYYRSIRLYNGILPQGIRHSASLRLGRVKYFDYGHDPCWRAVREFSEE